MLRKERVSQRKRLRLRTFKRSRQLVNLVSFLLRICRDPWSVLLRRSDAWRISTSFRTLQGQVFKSPLERGKAKPKAQSAIR